MRGKTTVPSSATDDLLRVVGVHLPEERVDEVVDGLVRYLELLTRWNQAHNLTGFRSWGDLVRLGVGDSILPQPLLPAGVPAVDVGSGAGFPAVPLALADPGRSWTLLEPRRKRASFLVEVCHRLQLSRVEVRRERLEAHGPVLPLLTSRAVGGLEGAVHQRLAAGGSWVVATTRGAVEAGASGPLRLRAVVDANHEPGDGRCWARWSR